MSRSQSGFESNASEILLEGPQLVDEAVVVLYVQVVVLRIVSDVFFSLGPRHHW